MRRAALPTLRTLAGVLHLDPDNATDLRPPAFYDTDRSDFSLGWGAFVNATGRSGWNSVTITVTCRRQ